MSRRWWGPGLQSRLVENRDGWPAAVVIHDRAVVEDLVDTLNVIANALIADGAVGWACDLGDIRDLFEDALRYPDGVQVRMPERSQRHG